LTEGERPDSCYGIKQQADIGEAPRCETAVGITEDNKKHDGNIGAWRGPCNNITEVEERGKHLGLREGTKNASDARLRSGCVTAVK